MCLFLSWKLTLCLVHTYEGQVCLNNIQLNWWSLANVPGEGRQTQFAGHALPPQSLMVSGEPGTACKIELVGDKFGESLGGSQAPPSLWKVPGLPRKFPSDFPGSSPATSPEVLSLWNLTAIQRVPGSFPDFPGSFPDFPGSSRTSPKVSSILWEAWHPLLTHKNFLWARELMGTLLLACAHAYDPFRTYKQNANWAYMQDVRLERPTLSPTLYQAGLCWFGATIGPDPHMFELNGWGGICYQVNTATVVA